MTKPGDVLDVRALGVRVEIRRTAGDTGGELFEFDVVGRARGLIAQPHVHALQSERHEVIEGSMRLRLGGREHRLGPGDAMEVPAGAAHRQRPGDEPTGRVRVQLRPAGETGAFLRRLQAMSDAGALNRWGFPRPVAGARLVQDFAAEGRLAGVPLGAQLRLARGVLAMTGREYAFLDAWDVAAPREVVFEALADARTYPRWWRPVYLGVEADGPPAVGKESRQHFKGRLPYHLRTRSRIVRLEPPHVVAGEVDGDLRGRGVWTLTEIPGGTHVEFDWRVLADRRLLRILTPVLRPALRANHAWAIARAREGLEPYAQARAAERAAA
jgi:uncharacterized protein YndB with AHSA1/START domain/mannose-6-phosphate isomerase-like protein (cupin superfamily)